MPKPPPQPQELDEMMRPLRAFMKAKGLHESTTRDLIVETFLSAQAHLGLDAILQRVRARNPGVGMATVYRTMRLLEEAGLVQSRDFGAGPTLYEVTAGRPHHDHLVCENCGRIIEFVNEPIERLQEKIAEDHGFELLRHRHELFGVCQDCRSSG